VTTTKTESANGTSITKTTQDEQGGILLTAMLGRLFYERINLAAGVLHGDGAVSAQIFLGPQSYPEWASIRGDTYSRGKGYGLDERVNFRLKPFNNARPFNALFFEAGVESIHKINNKSPMYFGAGISFDDEDIKLLFALK
jgi:hypothetical protein